jgi:hypothetical protein
MARELTARERRVVARALRGPIGRGDLSAASIERRLVELLPPDVRALVVEAFAKPEPVQLRLFDSTPPTSS